MGQAQPSNAADVFDAERWRSPVDIDTGVISMPTAYANSAATAYEVAALEPVRAPGDGTLLYRGPLEGQESGFVIDHGKGLYSVLSSDMNWNLRTGPEPGDRLEQGQFLASAAAAGERALLRWDVFFVSQAVSSSDGASVWRDVRAGQALHTRLLAGIGVVLFSVDGDRDGITLAVDGRELPRDRSFDTLFLFKATRLPLQVTSGTVFKNVNKDDMLLSARGVLNQVVGKKGNSGYAARMSNFVAVDLAGTETVMARLRSDSSASEVAQAPAAAPVVAAAPAAPAPAPAPAGPSAAELAERQRLQALAAQREQELERLREQLAQAEAQRQADAQRAAEAQRVAEARAAEAVRLAEAQRAAEQQRQADAQAQALRQQAAQQQAQQALQAEQAAEAQRVAALNTGKRKALVIGNDVYRSVPKLENARADARAMGQSLEALGFKVTMAMDQTERGMKETLRNFKSTVEGGDEVVVFYAGHGVQLGSTNYLLPVDIAGQDEEQVRDEAIQMQRILDDMQERRTGFMLMIVDACRDNPFKVAGRSIGGRGLAPTSAATGQMVIFSAGAGQQALDKLGATDKEPNGLFTRLFLREMKKPGVSVDRVLRSVRSEVARLARTVGHEQTPALYDQSLGDFFFKP
jgi:murein DD-endopeptidase MepM/ murein hydrolase activator NlpD